MICRHTGHTTSTWLPNFLQGIRGGDEKMVVVCCTPSMLWKDRAEAALPGQSYLDTEKHPEVMLAMP